jgi:hypothetical protein
MKEWRWYISEDDGTWEILCDADYPEDESGGTSWDPRTGAVIKCLLELYSLSRSDDVIGNSTFELSDSATKRG